MSAGGERWDMPPFFLIMGLDPGLAHKQHIQPKICPLNHVFHELLTPVLYMHSLDLVFFLLRQGLVRQSRLTSNSGLSCLSPALPHLALHISLESKAVAVETEGGIWGPTVESWLQGALHMSDRSRATIWTCSSTLFHTPGDYGTSHEKGPKCEFLLGEKQTEKILETKYLTKDT